MKIYTIAFLLCISTSIFSQSINIDSVLYLYFDKNLHHKIEHKPKYHNIQNKIVNPEDFYAFKGDYNLYAGYPVEFYSIDKSQSKVINKKELKRLNVYTIDELKFFLLSNYPERDPSLYDSSKVETIPTRLDPKGSISFWKKIKHIYLIEPYSKNKVSITEVRLEVNIE